MLRNLLLVLAVLLATGAGRAAAQVLPVDTLPADTVPRESRAPRNAFIRALVLPGWGHYGIGAHRRGAFFTVTQTASWYMLIKTLRKLNRVQEREERLTGVAGDSLRALMAEDTALARQLADPIAFENALAQHPGLADARALLDSREDQREDWIAYTVAITLAAGIDAYVAAHLRDFPAAITTRPGPDGGVNLRVSVPVGPPGRR